MLMRMANYGWGWGCLYATKELYAPDPHSGFGIAINDKKDKFIKKIIISKRVLNQCEES